MSAVIWWIVGLAIFAGLAAAVAVPVRAYLSGVSPRDVFFKPKADPRIAVVEQASLDGKRRLVLIRRDDVEHLIMTGGPVDMVIETGIGDQPHRQADAPPQSASAAPPAATVFTRAPRGLNPAANAAPDDSDVAVKR